MHVRVEDCIAAASRALHPVEGKEAVLIGATHTAATIEEGGLDWTLLSPCLPRNLIRF